MDSDGTVRKLDSSEHDAWDAFAAGDGGGTIFHTAWWHRAWGADVEIYASRVGDGPLAGGIALHTERYLGVRAVRRPPLTPFNGPVVAPSSKSKRSSRYSQNRRRVSEIMASCPRLGLYDFVLPPGVDDLMPFIWNGYSTSAKYTYVIPASEKDLWEEGMSNRNRRTLERAREDVEREGHVLVTDPPATEVAELLEGTAEVKGFASRRSTERLPAWWDAVSSRDSGRLYLLRDPDGRPACATVLVWDARSAYYIAGGMRRDLRGESRLNFVLIDRMIRDAHDLGRDFDFEGSIVPGVELFFRRWGGELRQETRLVKIPALHAYVLWNAHAYFRNGHRRTGWVSHL